MVPEKIVHFSNFFFAILLFSAIFKRRGPSFEQNWMPITRECLVANWIQNDPVVPLVSSAHRWINFVDTAVEKILIQYWVYIICALFQGEIMVKLQKKLQHSKSLLPITTSPILTKLVTKHPYLVWIDVFVQIKYYIFFQIGGIIIYQAT